MNHGTNIRRVYLHTDKISCLLCVTISCVLSLVGAKYLRLRNARKIYKGLVSISASINSVVLIDLTQEEWSHSMFDAD